MRQADLALYGAKRNGGDGHAASPISTPEPVN